MRDSAVCPVPASFTPTLSSPHVNSPLPCYPVSCPPVWDASLGDVTAGKQRDAPASCSQALAAPAPYHSSGFLCYPCHSPPPNLLTLKGLLNKMMREKGLQGIISLDPLLINYWSDIGKDGSSTPHDSKEQITCATGRHLRKALVNANTYLLMQLSSQKGLL